MMSGTSETEYWHCSVAGLQLQTKNMSVVVTSFGIGTVSTSVQIHFMKVFMIQSEYRSHIAGWYRTNFKKLEIYFPTVFFFLMVKINLEKYLQNFLFATTTICMNSLCEYNIVVLYVA